MKNDLRYQETEIQLMDAFSRAIAQRPIDRITVTGLVADAGVSKATFYQHYRDVRDLAETFAGDYARDQVMAMPYLGFFADDPQRFAEGFLDDVVRDDSVGMSLIENGLEHIYLDELVDVLVERLEQQGLAEPLADEHAQLQREMSLRFALHGLAALALRYSDERDDLVKVAVRLVVAAAGE